MRSSLDAVLGLVIHGALSMSTEFLSYHSERAMIVNDVRRTMEHFQETETLRYQEAVIPSVGGVMSDATIRCREAIRDFERAARSDVGNNGPGILPDYSAPTPPRSASLGIVTSTVFTGLYLPLGRSLVQ